MRGFPGTRVMALLAFATLPALGAEPADAGKDPESFGHWRSNVQADWLPDGRCMVITKDSVFDQRDGHAGTWTAPAGTHTDGASIPRSSGLPSAALSRANTGKQPSITTTLAR